MSKPIVLGKRDVLQFVSAQQTVSRHSMNSVTPVCFRVHTQLLNVHAMHSPMQQVCLSLKMAQVNFKLFFFGKPVIAARLRLLQFKLLLLC